MDFLHLTFHDFEFRDLGHSDFLPFKVFAPTQINILQFEKLLNCANNL